MDYCKTRGMGMNEWISKTQRSETPKTVLADLMQELGLDKAYNQLIKSDPKSTSSKQLLAFERELFALMKYEENIATAAFAQRNGMEFGANQLNMMIYHYAREMVKLDVAAGTNFSGIRGDGSNPLPSSGSELRQIEYMSTQAIEDTLKKKILDYANGKDRNRSIVG